MTTNVAASIRSRLLNKSKSDGIEFQVSWFDTQPRGSSTA